MSEGKPTPRTVVKSAKNKAGQVICKVYSDGTVLIADVRASYPHIDAMWRKNEKDTPAFSITGILPTATHQPAIDLLNEVCMDIIEERNKGRDIKDDAKFIRDGKPTKKPEYENAWIVASRETEKPTVLHPDKTEMESPSEIKKEIKAGYFIDMLVQPWWQDNEHGQRINASLRAVRLRREGPLIAEGGISKDAAISSFDDDDEGGFGGGTSDDDDGMGGL
jgi:hypothetical protein